jgi:3-methyladenine DNA glycosylase AlkD
VTGRRASEIVRAVEADLQRQAKPERAEYEKKYLKSSLRFIGVDADSIKATYRKLDGICAALSKMEIDALVDTFWNTDCHDLRSIGIGIMVRRRKLYSAIDLPRTREMIIDAAGWAHVDWISTHFLPSLYADDKKAVAAVLRKWSKDDDYWVRRASMLALMKAAKDGDRKSFELFCEFASRMVEEKEFFIRKAIGWVLREVSKKQPEWAFEFLERLAKKVSGLTFREGSKYLPPEMQETLRKKRAE